MEGHQEGSGYDFSQEVYDSTPGADIQTNLSLEHDAARANLPTPWRMPTAAEFKELYDNCTSVWTTLNGVAGRLFTSNVNGNTLFLPAAGRYDGTLLNYRGVIGYYWASTYVSATNARQLSLDDSSVNPQNSNGRHYGFSIRAVMSPSQPPQALTIDDFTYAPGSEVGNLCWKDGSINRPIFVIWNDSPYRVVHDTEVHKWALFADPSINPSTAQIATLVQEGGSVNFTIDIEPDGYLPFRFVCTNGVMEPAVPNTPT